jgi:lantibiotic transport system permease protein
MIAAFIYSFQSEWLKRRRSAASWLVFIGAFLIPTIIVVNRLIDFDQLYPLNTSGKMWEAIFRWCWQIMAVFLLPLGVILATSLVTQLEYRNNTWKQLNAGPQSFTMIFFSKLSVILVMMIQFFILFNLAVYLCGIIPSLVYRGIPFPLDPIPFWKFFKINVKYFIACMPIVAFQYMISIQFRNFLIPLGAGLGMYVASMIAISWKYGYYIPYTYCAYNLRGGPVEKSPDVNIHLFASGYFLLFIAVGYVLYAGKKDKS